MDTIFNTLKKIVPPINNIYVYRAVGKGMNGLEALVKHQQPTQHSTPIKHGLMPRLALDIFGARTNPTSIRRTRRIFELP